MMLLNLVTMSSASDCWTQVSTGQTQSGQAGCEGGAFQSPQLGAAMAVEAMAREAATLMNLIVN